MDPNPIGALIIIVDIERFGERPDAIQAELRHGMYHMLEASFRAADLPWTGCHREDRGDGVIIILPQASPVLVLGPLVRELHATLRTWAEAHTPPYALRLRMAVHHGFIWHDGSGWVGTAINTTARLVDARTAKGALRMHPDAALVLIISDELHRSVVSHGHPGIDAASYQETRVQAKETDTRAWLQVPGVACRPLPVACPDGGALTGPLRHTRLPMPLTQLIGRQVEQRQIGELLATCRLVTLVGPGGIGKTRLALAVAAAEQARSEVLFVPLADISDPDQLPTAIAAALRVPPAPGHALLEVISSHLAQTTMLLVLDNFEQIVAASPAVTALLAAAPQLTVLATSRQRLAVYGEQVYQVPSLSLPDLTDLPAGADRVPAALAASPALALFTDRARAVDSTFTLTLDRLPIVTDLCRHLDGLPLAIELAAARVNYWPPAELLRRLTSHLDPVGGGPRDRPPRQQTLRGTIDWSYTLLDSGCRRLFETLSVFTGGADLAAVTAVTAPDAGRVPGATADPDQSTADLSIQSTEDDSAVPAADDLPRRLEQLADASLLIIDVDHPAGRRFRLLETIRVYAAERLAVRPDAVIVHTMHARYFVELAERYGQGMAGPQQARWTDRIDSNYDNLRAALDWALTTGRSDLAVRTCLGLWRYWRNGSHLTEGRRWLARTRAASGELPAATAAKLLYAQAILAAGQDDHAEAHDLASQSLRHAVLADDVPTTAQAHNALGIAATGTGDYHRAAGHFRHGLHIWESLHEPQGTAIALGNLTKIALRLGDLAAADAYTRQCLHLERAADDTRGIALALEAVGQIRLAQGDIAGARRALDESLTLSRTLGDVFGEATAMHWLGIAAHLDGDTTTALQLLVGALTRRCEVHDHDGLAVSLDRIAAALLDADATLAAVVLAAAAQLRRRYRLPDPAEHETARRATTAHLRDRLAAPALAGARMTARATPLDQIIERVTRIVAN